MLAYHNDPQLKQQILQQLQGSGWNVSIEDYKNGLGIPKTLIYLHDAISRGLPNYLAKNWPIRFISAIQVGADLSTVWRDFVVWMLIDPADGVIQYTTPGSDAHRVIMRVATLYRDGYTQQQMLDAAVTAKAAAHADYNAYAAANASYNAANAVIYAAAAGFSSDAAASYAAAAVYFYVYAAANARSAAFAAAKAAIAAVLFIKISNKLIELLEKQEIDKHVSLP